MLKSYECSPLWETRMTLMSSGLSIHLMQSSAGLVTRSVQSIEELSEASTSLYAVFGRSPKQVMFDLIMFEFWLFTSNV